MRFVFLFVFLGSVLFANYQSQFQSFEDEKLGLVNRYKIRLDLAKLDNLDLRTKVIKETLICFVKTSSTYELDLCKINERKRLLKIVKRRLNDKPVVASFPKEKRNLIKKYQSKYENISLNKRKHFLDKTLNCLKNSEDSTSLKVCKRKDKKYVKNIIHSFEDNPKLTKIRNKQMLIQRYEIRVETARLDRLYDRVNIFSKTLKCLRNGSVDYCKRDEKNRILAML